MNLGSINNPERDFTKEICLFGDMDFDFWEIAVHGKLFRTPRVLDDKSFGGIGWEKWDFLNVLKTGTNNLMEDLMKFFDSNVIMNPGKMF